LANDRWLNLKPGWPEPEVADEVAIVMDFLIGAFRFTGPLTPPDARKFNSDCQLNRVAYVGLRLDE
jgi:hypothetical protein